MTRLCLSDVVAGWGRPATRPVSLRLEDGEIVGLVGPNGVGKSTLLAAIAGRARMFGGELALAAATRLALQAQEIPAVKGVPLSGGDVLRLTGALAEGLPDWLADKLDWRLDQLSGGQRHYLCLWAVLQSPADLILLDEPTNNLDAAGTEHLGLALRQRAASGAAVLVVSHDDAFVAANCHRSVRLEA